MVQVKESLVFVAVAEEGRHYWRVMSARSWCIRSLFNRLVSIFPCGHALSLLATKFVETDSFLLLIVTYQKY